MDREHGPLDDTQPIATLVGDDAVAQEDPVAPDRLPFLSTSTLAIWLAVVIALVAFVMLGRVTIHPDGSERTMRVVTVWVEMADELPAVSRHSVLVTLYVVALAVTVVGSFAALLIALATRDPEASQPHGGSASPPDQPALESAGSGD